MSTILCCNNINPDNSFMKIVEWVIPFLLGLLSSFIIDRIRNHFKRKKNKRFVLAYLEKCILSDLPKLKSEYEKISETIKEYSREKYKISAFETFNEKILDRISPTEYYEIFKNDYILINEIISIIEFLHLELPYKIMDEHFSFINAHLKEKDSIGDVEHVRNCPACIEKREETLSILSFRINETELLSEKIKNLIKNCG